MSHIIVLTTTSSKQEAEKIVRQLLNRRLIACANTIGPVISQFWWKGKIEEADEFLVLMKTREKHFKKLSKVIKQLHSYEVPEILALPVLKGWPPYLEWLNSSVASKR